MTDIEYTEQLKNETDNCTIVNECKIVYNEYWELWQVHPMKNGESDARVDFKNYDDAVEFCKNY